MKSTNVGGKLAQSVKNLPAGPSGSGTVSTTKATCKRGTKLCGSCNQGNPIHCALCKHCSAPFPKKNKSAVQDDLMKSLQSDTGRVTKAMINNLKDVVESRVFADHLFRLGKRPETPILPKPKSELLPPPASQNLPLLRKSPSNTNTAPSLPQSVSFFLSSLAKSRDLAPSSPLTLEVDGSLQPSFGPNNTSYVVNNSENVHITGTLGFPIESCAVWSDGTAAGVVCGVSGSDKTSDVAGEDAKYHLGKTQHTFGLAGLQKTGRVYPGKSYLGLYKVGCDVNGSPSLENTGFIETLSDIMDIKIMPFNLSSGLVVLSAIGADGTCALYRLKKENFLQPGGGLLKPELSAVVISLPGEILSTSGFQDDTTLILGSQSGALWVAKLKQRSPGYTIIKTLNSNKNFFVTSISTLQETSIFAAAFGDGFIKFFDSSSSQSIYEYQSINVVVILIAEKYQIDGLGFVHKSLDLLE